jgi:hypothetical protein
MSKSPITLTFDNNSKNNVLELFNKTIDKDDFIVENSNEKRKVLTPEGEFININEFAGIIPGSEIFVKNDIFSLIKVAEMI